MSYRDDLDATRARADALERELAAAKEKIAELEGGTALVRTEGGALVRREGAAVDRLSASGPATHTWLAGPTRLGHERVIDGELPESAYTELVETIRRTIGEPGTTSMLPGSLTWTSSALPNSTGPHLNVYVSVRHGKTTLRADEKLGHLAGAIFGGVGGGVGGGGIMLPIAAAFVNPLLLAVTLPVWLGGTYLACRKIYRGRASARANRLESLMDELAELVEREIAAAAEASTDDDA